jgi:hypothetical protein
MPSPRVQMVRALTILIGLTFGHGVLAEPRITDDPRRLTPRPTAVPAPAPASMAGWVAFGSRNATDIAVGANGVVWIIGNDPPGVGDKTIYRWDGNAFQQIAGAGVRIAVDPNGRAWMVNTAGAISRWGESSW